MLCDDDSSNWMRLRSRVDSLYRCLAIEKSMNSTSATVATIVVIAMLGLTYFGLWEITRRWGVNNVEQTYSLHFAESPAPFVVCGDIHLAGEGLLTYGKRGYYVWIFGMTIRVSEEDYVSGPVF